LSNLVRAFAVVVALVLLPALAGANEVELQLERIKADVEAGSARLEGLVKQRQEREGALKALQKEVTKLRNEEAALNRELEAGRRKWEELDKETGRLGREMVRLKDVAVGRVRALYMYRNRAVADHVIGASSSGELLKNAYFLGRVSAHDRELLAEMRGVVSANEAVQKQLKKVNAEQLRVKGEITKRGAALRVKVADEERLVAQIENEEAELEEALTTMRAQALRLETVLVSLIEGESAENARGAVQAKPLGGGLAPVEPFSGAGLEKVKGKLPRPVTGKIVTPFGRTKRARFEDYIFSKGQEYLGAPGAAVTAVSDGRVLHMGPMPGYGTIVILDHGARSYSLYGKMGEILVTRGQDIDKGGELGRLAPAEGEGGNLYFEIRKNGSPVDPSPYFR
jgi:septal ring factor EnvC (AmiA/AmiB activator)